MPPCQFRRIRKGSAGSVFKRALECAIRDREAFEDAMKNSDEKVVAATQVEIAEFRELLRELFGDDTTDNDRMTATIGRGRSVSIKELKQIASESLAETNSLRL